MGIPGIKLAKDTVRRIVREQPDTLLTVARDVICGKYETTAEIFHARYKSGARKQNGGIQAVQMFCYMCHIEYEMTSIAVGRFVSPANEKHCAYDHTSVLHSVQVIRNYITGGIITEEYIAEIRVEILNLIPTI